MASEVVLHACHVLHRYEGDTLADGTPHGAGVLHLASGNVYEGRFVNGVMHGPGTWTYENGDIFKGTFSNGSAIGEAEFKASDGSLYKVFAHVRCDFLRAFHA